MIQCEDRSDSHLNRQYPRSRIYTFSFLTLLIVILITYGNSFHCEWHYDDFINIVDNPNVHLRDLTWQNVQKAFYGLSRPRPQIERPLSYLSFALNYYIGGVNVFGYHVVNVVIHYITSVFLFLFIFSTLKLPLLAKQYRSSAYAIALLAVFFWTLHPIQVTAVTYIVQRMASMAAMFYIMAMYFYLKGRTATTIKKHIVF
jgi:hypothetical protein